MSTIPFRDGLPTEIKNKKGIEKNYYENFKRTAALSEENYHKAAAEFIREAPSMLADKNVYLNKLRRANALLFFLYTNEL